MIKCCGMSEWVSECVLTVGAGPCRRVWWRRHPAGTGGSEPNPEYDHWTGTWNTHTNTQVQIIRILKIIRILIRILNHTRIWASPLSLSPFVVIVHEGRHGADLDSVGVVGRVLKQTIIRVEQLPGNQEEELSGRPAVVQPATHTHTDLSLLHTVVEKEKVCPNSKTQKDSSKVQCICIIIQKNFVNIKIYIS